MLGFGFLTIFWGNFGQSFFVSWYGVPIQESLDLSASAYGIAYSAATLASGISIALIGGLVDRVPLRLFAVTVALGLMISTLVLSIAGNLYLLILGFFLLRLCGQGLLPHTSMTAMARHFDLNRGKALSVAGSGVPLGEIILPGLAVALIGLLGWERSWLVVALSVPLLYIPAIVYLLKHVVPGDGAVQSRREPTGEEPETGVTRGGRREMLTDPRFWLALPALVAAPFIVTGVFIHQGFITAEKGWSPALLAGCFVLYGFSHWTSSIGTGVLVDRWSAVRLLPFYTLPLAAGLLFSAVFDGNWVAAVMMMSLGTTIGSGIPLGGSLWAEVYGVEKLGAIRSLFAAIMVLSTSASPVLLGYLIDHDHRADQLLTYMGTYAAAAALLAAFSYRRRHPIA